MRGGWRKGLLAQGTLAVEACRGLSAGAIAGQPEAVHLAGAMSGLLRSSVGRSVQGLLRTSRPSSLQQQRFAGDLPVKNNKHIEDWSTRREHIENEFKWDATTWKRVAIWLVAFPAFVYAVTVKEYNHADAVLEKPKRDFM